MELQEKVLVWLEDDLRLDMGIARLDAKSCWNMALHLWVPNGSNWPNWSYRLMILVELLFLDDRFMLTRFGVTSMKRNWWCKDPTFPRYMLPILELTMEVRMFLQHPWTWDPMRYQNWTCQNHPKPGFLMFSDGFCRLKNKSTFCCVPRCGVPCCLRDYALNSGMWPTRYSQSLLYFTW